MNEKKPTTYVRMPEIIRMYREHKGMTVLQFARFFEVSPQAVYMWENGTNEAPYRVTEMAINWYAGGSNA